MTAPRSLPPLLWRAFLVAGLQVAGLAPAARAVAAAPERPLGPGRHLVVGGTSGLAVRPGDSAGLAYQPGFTIGGYLRPEITRWLGVRGVMRHELLGMSVEPGGFDTSSDAYTFDFSQPTIDVTVFELLAEPTWVLCPRLRLLGQVGLGWLKLSAPAPTAPGFALDGARHGVELNLLLGGGLTFDLLEDWLVLELTATHGFSFDQRGTAYEPLQAVVDGSVTYLAPLPKPEGMTNVLLSVGLVL